MADSLPPLIERIAARLCNADGQQLAMATLISPWVALTTAHIVDDHQGYSLDPALSLGERSGNPNDLRVRGPLTEASVIASDRVADFAALELHSTLEDRLPADFAALELHSTLEDRLLPVLLSTYQPTRGTHWESCYVTPVEDQSRRILGTFLEDELVNGRRYFKLAPAVFPREFPPEADGAPVTADNQLVGVLTTRPETPGDYWYAIPLSEMLNSPAWKLVDEAMQSPSAAAKEPEPTHQFLRVTVDLNVRQGPSVSDAVITDLYANSVVENRGESADKKWFRVMADKDGAAIEGWVEARFLEPADGPITTPSRLSTAQFDSVAFIKRLSDSSLSALAHANRIRIVRQQPKMHMDHLIAGLSSKEDSPTRRELQRAGVGQDQLAQLVGKIPFPALPAEGDDSPFITDEFPPPSEHVEQALVAAAAFADQKEPKLITSRHLIRGALSVSHCRIISTLLQAGVEPAKISLDDEPLPPAAPRRPTQAGISSDDPEGVDLLDIRAEVKALCTVLASKDVKPPISLGLFGDWGSGKSFFMKKMEERFKKLAAVGPDSAYCTNIVQLWFNAWHYMDTNLWASLAKEIFDKLAQELARQEALAAGTKDPDYERAQLVAQRATANEAVAKAEQEKCDADTKVRVSEQQLTSIQSGETPVAMNPRAVLREVYRFAGQQPEVRKTVVAANNMLDKKVEEAATALNIDRDAALVREQLLELRGLWGYVWAIWLAARNTRNKWLWLLSAVCLLIVVRVVWLLPLVLSQEWIQSAWLRLTGVGLALLAAAAPFTPTALRALQIIHGAIKSSHESIEQARLEAEKKMQLEHQELQEDAIKAQATLERAVTTARELTDKLENLRADRQMSNFIRQRQQSSDYTRYLGVIAKARNDFEQLSTLLTKERERSEKEQEERRKKKQQTAEANVDGQKAGLEDLLPRIDRIILYIDDLDRCPEHKVVDVLQAVHLLLAFPLFVVVVGVDPRWLLHSLRQHSKAFQDQIEADESSEEERTHWRSTPLNYLEKIFQIPFTLNPMGKSGFANMIETLTERPKADQKKAEPDEGKVTEPEPDKVETTPELEAAPIESADQVPVPPPVSEEPAVVTAPAGEESWATKVLSFLKRTFGKLSRTGEAAAATPEPAAVETPASVTQEQPKEAEAAEPSAGEKTQTSMTDAADQASAEVIEPRPDHLLINSWEQKFMKELHELVPSPRATKRFVNIYRLIRASVDLDEKLQLEEFTGNDERGKYRPVLLLLAILTGYPDQATEILRELLEKDHPELWWDFIDSLKGRAEKRPVTVTERPHGSEGATGRTPGTKSNNNSDKPITLDDKVVNAFNEVDAEGWEQLLGKLKNLRHLFKSSQSCADFVEWAPKVARYSFQSGRVLITRSVRSSETGEKSVTMQVPKNDKPAHQKKPARIKPRRSRL